MTGTRRFRAAVLCLLLPASSTIPAQGLERGTGSYSLPPDSVPAWTVPVLRLVSATHVEPTTGVIISDTGLVLVPENFATSTDEIIVLDGGTDIIRNGRPAKIERQFKALGLQVLSVEGLKRQGATLGSGPFRNGGQVTLHAFPPAEQIAEGEPPLNQQASLVVFSENERPSISRETPLPNVTGALADRCGNLVGVSLADGVQTMETSAATAYRWSDILREILQALQVTPREADCAEEAPAAEPEPEEETVEEKPEEEQPPVEPAEPEAIEEPPPEPVEEETTEEDAAPPGIDILPPIEKDTRSEPAEDVESPASGWWWLVSAVILIGLGLGVHRWRRTGQQDSGGVETGTVPSGNGEEGEEPYPEEAPLDGLLRLRGVLADGTDFESSCPVSRNAINLVIGRGDADLVIDSPAVSRRHAVLNGAIGELTVSDLGSSNGTSINGVPCTEGEIMYIEAGDTLVLGDATFSIEISRREEGGGA